MIHLHVRDRDLAHVLDVSAYRAAIQAVRSQVGDKLVIQVTTESCGLYGPEEQMGLVRETQAGGGKSFHRGNFPRPDL